MKRTPLKRKTPLKAKKGLKRTGFKNKGSKLKRSSIKPKRDNAKSECDRLWQRLIWLMWGGKCAMCGKKLGDGEGAGHHLISRRVLLFRHDPKNGILLCDRCHTSNKDSAHGAPAMFMDDFIHDKYPAIWDWYQENRGCYGTTKPDYTQVAADLRVLIKEVSA